MSKKHKAKLLLSRKTLVMIAIVSGVLLLAFGAGLLVTFLLRTANQQASDGNGLIGLPTNPQPKAVVDAQRQVAAGDYNKAQATLETAAATSQSEDDKYSIYIQQGINATDQKQYAQAIASYQKAAAVRGTVQVYTSLGEVAELQGNKQLAIESYKKAISLFSSDDRPSEKKALEDKIKSLGG